MSAKRSTCFPELKIEVSGPPEFGLAGSGNLGVLFGCLGRKMDGFRFLVYQVVFNHLPGKPIYLP